MSYACDHVLVFECAVLHAEAIVCNVLLPHRIAVSIIVAAAHELTMHALEPTPFWRNLLALAMFVPMPDSSSV